MALRKLPDSKNDDRKPADRSKVSSPLTNARYGRPAVLRHRCLVPVYILLAALSARTGRSRAAQSWNDPS